MVHHAWWFAQPSGSGGNAGDTPIRPIPARDPDRRRLPRRRRKHRRRRCAFPSGVGRGVASDPPAGRSLARSGPIQDPPRRRHHAGESWSD